MHSLADGRYEIVDELGSGGAARVYRARDTLVGDECAIKIVHERATSKNMARRLRNEHRAMDGISHPNVLPVRDVGVDDEGRGYVVMELAPNGNLSDRVDARGPLPTAEAVERITEVLSALSAAHAQGIVHRDVKPQNILLGADGQALLADFGIALVGAATRATRAGTRLGSVAFMAPEQRLDARSVDQRADVYAVAATLFHLLTGANPVDLFMADITSPRFYGIPEPLVLVIVCATRKDPAERYPDAESMSRAVRAALVQVEQGDSAIANYAVTGSVRLPTTSGTSQVLYTTSHPGTRSPTQATESASPRLFAIVAVVAGLAGASGAALIWYLASG
ncbi:MAG: serine/threonine protein kinase [Myxococcota bacterium]